jgi:hypothetical protein
MTLDKETPDRSDEWDGMEGTDWKCPDGVGDCSIPRTGSCWCAPERVWL